MKLSYFEKRTWISLVTTLIAFGPYFYKAFSVLGGAESSAQCLVPYFITTVVLVIIVQIVLQVSLAISDQKAAAAGMDERDKSIDLRTTRNSYYLLVVGIWLAVVSQLFDSDPAVLINLLMLFFILAELQAYVSKLIIYRRGF